tara:strand:- start:534 stop:785 length:252 start_codon:yes stop_codon:yes gene_type:complete
MEYPLPTVASGLFSSIPFPLVSYAWRLGGQGCRRATGSDTVTIFRPSVKSVCEKAMIHRHRTCPLIALQKSTRAIIGLEIRNE